MANFRWKKSAEALEKEIEQDKKLIDSVKAGDESSVTDLLSEGASPDATEYNRSLFYASKNYLTPLQLAVKLNFPKVVATLIDHCADVNAKDRFDVTAVHMAAEKGHLECLQHLLEGGADCNVSTKYSKYGSYTATPHPGGTTALHLAATNNHVKCTVELIWYGADYNAVDEYGRTSLYIAAQHGFTECVHQHLNNAIRMDILSIPVKDTNETPLHECVRHGLSSCVSSLLEHGSDVNHRNDAGMSALHLAVVSGEKYSKRILRDLTTKGYNTDVNLTDKQGSSPLHYVCFNDHSNQERRPDAAAFLIAYGADFNIKNKAGDNLLQQELRNQKEERAILESIVNCSLKLPSLELLCPTMCASNPSQQGYNRNENASPSGMSKYEWYRSFCRDPRTLQHCCRYVIRQTLGGQRLRKVPTLPLPTTLKEYLLLDVETFS
ncbi:ankyrin repeat and SOCS box protein 7-like [Haliotis cracherodii]|uniref:ankyrin repeat and SOCS box protein 7-like n=1 Tax=Haliotis cracherodii TaxID=6455 RepID=UPI0039E94C22